MTPWDPDAERLANIEREQRELSDRVAKVERTVWQLTSLFDEVIARVAGIERAVRRLRNRPPQEEREP